MWHLHAGVPPSPELLGSGEGVSFAMLLNLASVANSDDPAVLWSFLQRYAPSASPLTHPRLDAMVRYATAYFRDFVRPAKRYRPPDEEERAVLTRLADLLGVLPPAATPEAIQTALYDLARTVPRYQTLTAKGATPEKPGVSNEFFNMLYQVLLGEDRGPRFGSFAALYGVANTRKLVEDALAGRLGAADAPASVERNRDTDVAAPSAGA